MRSAFRILCLIVWLSFSSYSQSIKNSSSNNLQDLKLEDRIIDKIVKLPEVKKRAKYVESQTNGKRHLQYTIWKKPTNQNKYYWVTVMEDNGVSYYTHFNFFVDSNFSIMYMDTINDTLIDLATWRKKEKGR